MGTIRVVPDYVAADRVEEKFGVGYRCPVCESQNTADREDIGWLRCPVLEKPICLGCYLDLSGICNRQDFRDHPYFDTLEKLAGLIDKSVEHARRTYIEFQLNELEDQEGRVRYEYSPTQIRKELGALLR